jgi:hypothetical protein
MFNDKEGNTLIEQEIKDEERRRFRKRLKIGGVVLIVLIAACFYIYSPKLFGDKQETQTQTSVTGFVELENISTASLENEIDRLYKLAYEQAMYGTQSGNSLSSAASGLANTYQLEIMRRALGIQEGGK